MHYLTNVDIYQNHPIKLLPSCEIYYVKVMNLLRINWFITIFFFFWVFWIIIRKCVLLSKQQISWQIVQVIKLHQFSPSKEKGYWKIEQALINHFFTLILFWIPTREHKRIIQYFGEFKSLEIRTQSCNNYLGFGVYEP